MFEKLTESPKKTEKPWGYELLWAHTKDYVAKVLFIRKGESLSLQFHREKEETLFVDSGECLFEAGENESCLKQITLGPGGVFHIPPKFIHRMTALTDCRLFEVSTTQIHDVVRLKDNYGRS